MSTSEEWRRERMRGIAAGVQARQDAEVLRGLDWALTCQGRVTLRVDLTGGEAVDVPIDPFSCSQPSSWMVMCRHCPKQWLICDEHAVVLASSAGVYCTGCGRDALSAKELYDIVALPSFGA